MLKSDAVSNFAFDIVTIAFCDVFTANLPASFAASMPACNCWLTEGEEKKNKTKKNGQYFPRKSGQVKLEHGNARQLYSTNRVCDDCLCVFVPDAPRDSPPNARRDAPCAACADTSTQTTTRPRRHSTARACTADTTCCDTHRTRPHSPRATPPCGCSHCTTPKPIPCTVLELSLRRRKKKQKRFCCVVSRPTRACTVESSRWRRVADSVAQRHHLPRSSKSMRQSMHSIACGTCCSFFQSCGNSPNSDCCSSNCPYSIVFFGKSKSTYVPPRPAAAGINSW